MLETGQKAPDFSTLDQSGAPVRLADYEGVQHVVLYFYPKDDTPGCTIEAKDFSRLARDFSAAGAVVFGVSRDSSESHRDFIDKYGLDIGLLADTSGDLCERYGVWQEKEKNGERRMGIMRSTFIVDREGRLAYVEYGVDPNGHAERMLERVRTL
ncbi:peroxiredoxin [Acidihalobacter prosperus]|uniref:thioredoxin-dependent peroxiredoxin n=1 Tax=Acidihalobacter prosperus TaxID=160660 RepID=A0A1A6C1M9_9GAMM|nr:peroxiredoxin [Acidihalobacter prosperus]OBS08454.1 peroxiredoxin [Acidihalobacter prosperus]